MASRNESDTVWGLVLGAFAAAYVMALAILAVGTFGRFGSERGPLAGVFLVPLGMPWTFFTGALPDGLVRMAGAVLSPVPTWASSPRFVTWRRNDDSLLSDPRCHAASHPRGCPTLVFTPDGAGYTLVSTIGLTRPPIRVSPHASDGWHNLIVEIGGGGGRSGHAELAYREGLRRGSDRDRRFRFG